MPVIYKMHSRLTIVLGMSIAAFLLYFLMVWSGMIAIADWEQLHMPASITALLCSAMFIADRSIPVMGTSFSVFFYMLFTLLGLVVLLPIFPELFTMRGQTTMAFIFAPELAPAIALACISITVFTLASSCFWHTNKNPTDRSSILGHGLSDLKDSPKSVKPYAALFALLILAGCFIYFAVFISKRPEMLGVTYDDRLISMSENAQYIHALILMALSFVMVCSSGTQNQMRCAIVLFLGLAAMNFMLGNRGEIYYPLLAGIAAYTKRGGTFKKQVLFPGIAGSVILISAVRVLRSQSEGFNNVAMYITQFSPMQAIAETFGEMGYQIATIVYTMQYVSQKGQFQHGATLVYSFQKFFSKYISVIPAVDPASPLAIKTIMPVSYIAYTNVGDAYYNFGLVGVVGFCILLAFVLMKIGQKQKHNASITRIFLDMFVVILVFQVRNTTASVPVYLAWMCILVGVGWCFERLGPMWKKHTVRLVMMHRCEANYHER